MRLSPQPLVIGPTDGFKPETDTFGLKEFGERFANVVSNLDQPVTIVLDGEWGSGKTTFMQQWAGHLRQKGVAVIEFNAFANDHHEDAFVVLAAEIIGQAKETLGGSESRYRKTLNSAKKVATALMPLAARIALKVGTLGIVASEDLSAIGEAGKLMAKEMGEEASKSAQKVLADRLAKARDEKTALEGFRECLSDLATGMAEKASEKADRSSQAPLVVIIDELDRCRPPFALKILERIKHLFSVSGVTFVLVTNLAQLRAAVCGTYGPEIDAQLYLEKFYDLRVILPEPSDLRNSREQKYVSFLWKELGLTTNSANVDESVQEEFVRLAKAHGLSLRTIARATTHIALTYAALGRRTLKLTPLIAGLAVMRQANPALYDSCRHKQQKWKDIFEFIRAGDSTMDENEYPLEIWKYASLKEMDVKIREKYSNLEFEYGMRDRLGILSWGASMIDAFVISNDR